MMILCSECGVRFHPATALDAITRVCPGCVGVIEAKFGLERTPSTPKGDPPMDQAAYLPAVAAMPALSIGQARERRHALISFVKEIMVEGVDYGPAFPGSDTNVLLKPGAEKLTTFFGLSVEFEDIVAVEDWTGADHGGEPFFYYRQRCRLSRQGTLIVAADGSANSWEQRYRWVWVSRHEVPKGLALEDLGMRADVAEEYAFAVQKRETGGKYGKPTEYWDAFQRAIDNKTAEKITKTTRSGNPADAWRISSETYRVPNPHICDVANTVLKQSQKRSLTASTLLAVGLSDLFTQDLEDMAAPLSDMSGTGATSGNGTTRPPQPEPEKQADKSLSKTTPSKAEPKEEPKATASKAEPTPTPTPPRPGTPEQVRHWLEVKVKRLAKAGRDCNTGLRGACVSALEALFPTNNDLLRKQMRYSLLDYIFSVQSSKDLSGPQVLALLDWAQEDLGADGEGKLHYAPNKDAVIEAARIINQVEEQAGQSKLPDDLFKDDLPEEAAEIEESADEVEGVQEMPF